MPELGGPPFLLPEASKRIMRLPFVWECGGFAE
jgi:hypothetical protein